MAKHRARGNRRIRNHEDNGEPHRELANRLREVPRDIGVMFVGIGFVGVIVPGPIPLGMSLVVLGTAILCPSIVTPMRRLVRRFPQFFGLLIRFIDRLRLDLERRYPGPAHA